MVNLGRLYVIVNVTVSGKEDSYERLRDFYIRVGNSSDITKHVDCAYKSGWVKLRVRETFRCNSTLVGSWVSIQRTNDKGSTDDGGHGWLQLCEVQVFGFEKRPCRHREFGPACQNMCHCAKNSDCNKETGVCPAGVCDLRYGGNTCSIKPEKPVITDITSKRVTGGANMTVSFTLSEDGHNCIRYRKFDIRRRLLDTSNTPWTDVDRFNIEGRRVAVFFNAMVMTKKHEIRIKFYNNDNKWTESDSRIFTPITVLSTSMASTPYALNTITSTTSRRFSVSKAYTEAPTKNMLATGPSVNDTSTLKTATIVGYVIVVVFLIITIVLLVYIWRLKRGTTKDRTTKSDMRDVEGEHVTGNQDENIRAEVPGTDRQYERVELSPVERHSYVNVEGNKYETLDKQQITHPSPKAYAKLGRL